MLEEYKIYVAPGALALLAFTISMLLTRIFSLPGFRYQILDVPNARSLHAFPVSRIGGIAICMAIIVVVPISVYLFEEEAHMISIALGAAIIALVSFLDDRFTLSVMVRFVVHGCAAALLIVEGFRIISIELPGWYWQWPFLVSVGFTVLYVIWMVNLYNFMDGMDGFSGGMAVIGFGTYALLGWQGGALQFATLNLIVAGSVLGFLLFNFPPAKIFMGDVGASTMGFVVASFSLWAHRDGIFPIWIAVLVFSPFIVDATITLLKRLWRGERIWEAHKSHYYQRLVQAGWGHRKTVLWEYLIMTLCGVSAIAILNENYLNQWLLLLTWGLAYAVIITMIGKMPGYDTRGVVGSGVNKIKETRRNRKTPPCD